MICTLFKPRTMTVSFRSSTSVCVLPNVPYRKIPHCGDDGSRTFAGILARDAPSRCPVAPLRGDLLRLPLLLLGLLLLLDLHDEITHDAVVEIHRALDLDQPARVLQGEVAEDVEPVAEILAVVADGVGQPPPAPGGLPDGLAELAAEVGDVAADLVDRRRQLLVGQLG